MDAVRSSPKFWSSSELELSRKSPTSLTVIDLVIIVTGSIIALVSARDYAGSYNDGSRLASVESLVDYQTWKIDRSIFLNYAEGPCPEVWGPNGASPHGHLDKLLIGGHFYSDKPPLMAVLMAADYQVTQWISGLTAREHPKAFCYWMTLTTSGFAYVVSVWSVYRVTNLLGLPLRTALLVVLSFGLATLTPAYARQVNASIVLLAIASLLVLVMVQGSDGGRPLSQKLTVAAGALTGFGYSTDLGCGLVLLFCTALWVIHVSSYRLSSMVLFGIGALPFLLGHHILNYLIGGTLGPMNTVPEYFRWPDSPFSEKNLTGVGSGHETLGVFLGYSFRFLFGNKGFLYHNPELFLAIAGFFGLVRVSRETRPMLLALGAWAFGTWLLYALKSKDYSGYNVSIRWMVPTLIAGYLILAVQIRESPGSLREFLILSLFGLPVAVYDWNIGTWTDSHIRGFHAWIALAVLCGLVSYLMRTGRFSITRIQRTDPPLKVDSSH
jgi:hypothetical protein